MSGYYYLLQGFLCLYIISNPAVNQAVITVGVALVSAIGQLSYEMGKKK